MYLVVFGIVHLIKKNYASPRFEIEDDFFEGIQITRKKYLI